MTRKIIHIDKDKGSLSDNVKFTLENGFEFEGSRIEGITQMIEPFLHSTLKGVSKSVMLNADELLDLHKKAYLSTVKTHKENPVKNILTAIDDCIKLYTDIKNDLVKIFKKKL